MRKAVVTGASGFIGKALVKRLLQDGYQVYAVVRDVKKLVDLQNPNLVVTRCESDNYNSLTKQVPADGVDIFFHLAWDGVSGKNYNDLKIQLKNILSSQKAVEAALHLGCQKFVFFGSSHQYKRLKKVVGGVEVTYNNSYYGIAKTMAQNVAQKLALDNEMDFCTILFTNVFGVGDASNRSTNTILRQMLLRQQPKLVEGNILYDWTYIDDAVEGILAVAQQGKCGAIYYIGLRQLFTLRKIIEQVRDIAALDMPLTFGSIKDDSYIDYRLIDTDKLYQDTGFTCKRDFAESIRKTIQWLQLQ